MKNKPIVFLLLIALLLSFFSVTAFAADLTNEDVVDAQGGFFRDLGRYISDGFNKTISNAKDGINSILLGLKNSVNAIGEFFSKLIIALNKAIGTLLKGIYDLFVPHDDYFDKIIIRLQSAISKKLGSVTSFSSYLLDRFSKLRSNPNSDNMLIVDFPDGHMYGGANIDFMSQTRPYIFIFRDAISALMVLSTMVFVFRRINKMIDT